MERFDTNSFINSEIVKQEFRNHAQTSDQNLKQLMLDLSELIIEVYANEQLLSLKELRKEILKNIKFHSSMEEFLNSKIHDMNKQYLMICENQSRNKLGLKFAIYQGGLRDDSRLFCLERNNKCF
ncbi:MAG TPA: hypothetical protein PKD85_16525, partial [Saprospiraceae bacterium]|nr:hypothetical protein [Saprospiraceae bacterium]